MQICFAPTCAVCLALFACVNCQADDVPPPPQPIQVPAGGAAEVPVVPDPEMPPVFDIKAAKAVAEVPFNKLFKDELLKNLAHEIVVQKEHDWGHQAHVPSVRGVRVVEVQRNHGNWERMKLICRDLPHRLSVVVDNLTFSGPERVAFTAHVEVPADVEFEKQIWQNGVQIFVGHSRGRVRFQNVLVMETAVKIEGRLVHAQPGSFKLCEAKIATYDFVPEHVNGLGGDLAQMSGGHFQRTFHGHFQTAFEREVQGKIKHAVVKSSESGDIAAGWNRLLANMAVQQAPPNRYDTVVVTSPEDPEMSVLMPRTPFVLVPACPGAAL